MQTVKMVAIVDGDTVPVGKCHPGQARILQKQGLATWQDGKLLLLQVPSETQDPKPNTLESLFNLYERGFLSLDTVIDVTKSRVVYEDGGVRLEIDPDQWEDPENIQVSQSRQIEAIRDTTGRIVELKAVPDSTETVLKWRGKFRHVEGQDSEVGWPPGIFRDFEGDGSICEAIDPDHELIDRVAGWNTGHLGTLKEIPCKTLREWCEALAERKKAGHDLMACDDPLRRLIGFTDADAMEWVYMGIVALKTAKEGEGEALGMTDAEVHEALSIQGSRIRLITPDYVAPDTPEDVGIDDLAALWDTAPKHPSNVSIDKPTFDPETGKVSFDVNGANVGRLLANVATVAGGRGKDHPDKHRYPGWSPFHWPDDLERIPINSTVREDLEIEHPPRLRGFFRRVPSVPPALLRVWGDFNQAYWDESRLNPLDNTYTLYGRHEAPGDWLNLDHAVECAESRMAALEALVTGGEVCPSCGLGYDTDGDGDCAICRFTSYLKDQEKSPSDDGCAELK